MSAYYVNEQFDAINNDMKMTSFSTLKEVVPPANEESNHHQEDGKEILKNGFDKFDEIPLPYAGMPKEVLLLYSRKRHFVWARNIMALLVILTILTLIAIVIAIIVISPPCLDFWQTSPIYQIYPKSFKNSGNDEYGDLNGISEKLDYLKDDLGVSVLWLNPVYASPQADSGYDIKDFRDIDPIFGTMDDMDELIAQMHNRGMKLIMDFIPNHSSEEHPWFIASSDPNHENYTTYKDYYIWIDGEEGTLPNNWQSAFLTEDSAWRWNDKRKQYYYHAFYKQQPDLNITNPAVQEELREILRFWLKKGVDGFRCDAVAFMYEAEHLRDNPVIDPTQPLSKDNVYPDYTEGYLGVHDVVADWRHVLDEYSTEPGVYRFMETEVYTDTKSTVRYYGTELVDEADLPMNFLLVTANVSTEWNAPQMESFVLEWMRAMPKGKWPNWVVSNHDKPRMPSRVGDKLSRCAAVMIMTLSGTPGLYYGDEIGMSDNDNIPSDQSNDFRDPVRTPMQWDATENAGFCEDCDPWLPVNDNYQNLNLENQMNEVSSMFNLYKELISMRQDTTFQRGWLCMLHSSNNILLYVRELENLPSYFVAINFDVTGSTTIPKHVSLRSQYPNFPSTGTVIMDSENMDNTEKVTISFNSLSLYPGQSLVVKFKTSSGNMFSKVDSLADRCFISIKVCFNSGLNVLQKC